MNVSLGKCCSCILSVLIRANIAEVLGEYSTELSSTASTSGPLEILYLHLSRHLLACSLVARQLAGRDATLGVPWLQSKGQICIQPNVSLHVRSFQLDIFISTQISQIVGQKDIIGQVNDEAAVAALANVEDALLFKAA